MFGPRARRHQAVPCEALTMLLSTCTHCCCDDGQYQTSSFRWLTWASFTQADNNGPSLVSCSHHNFDSEEDLCRSDTPGPYKTNKSPSSELVIKVTNSSCLGWAPNQRPICTQYWKTVRLQPTVIKHKKHFSLSPSKTSQLTGRHLNTKAGVGPEPFQRNTCLPCFRVLSSTTRLAEPPPFAFLSTIVSIGVDKRDKLSQLAS